QGVHPVQRWAARRMDRGRGPAPGLAPLRRGGARVLVNAIELEGAQPHLGGSFELMGVAVRAKEIEHRRAEMVALTKALADALKGLRGMTGEQLTAAFPKEMITGLNLKEFGDIVERHRDSLYHETVNIYIDDTRRVEQ